MVEELKKAQKKADDADEDYNPNDDTAPDVHPPAATYVHPPAATDVRPPAAIDLRPPAAAYVPSPYVSILSSVV